MKKNEALSPELTDAEIAAALASARLSDWTEEQARSLRVYTELLEKWNRKTNLVGPRTSHAIFHTLVADSLHLAAFLSSASLPENPETWDLGSGAGLPGIPLRIFWQQGIYALVEAREKRALFLQTVLAHLKLARTQVWQMDACHFMRKRTGGGKPADLIISRAFLPWQELLPFAAPFLNASGRLIVLSLEAFPPELPSSWTCERSHAYAAAGRMRYFWMLRTGIPH